MTRSRALLGCAAIATMVVLGFPSLTAIAADGAEPPTTELAAPGEADDSSTPSDETPVDETPVDETPVDETPVDETPVDETPVDETPVDETPVDETPVDETPVDETPVDETPVNDAESPAIPANTAVAPAPQIAVTATAPVNVPAMPTALTATRGYNQVTLSWASPIVDSGAPIEGFTISYAPGGGSWTSVNVSASTLARTITGLRGGSGYYFRVAAYNSVGGSPWTTSVKAVPFAYRTPGGPAIYSVTAGNQSAALYWSPPADTGGKPITHYQLQIGSAGVWHNLTFVPGTQRAYKATGLVNGRTYSFRVRAANAVGWSPVWSNAIRAVPVAPARVAPATVPGAPVGLTAISFYSGHDLDWYAPANGGSPITDYVIQYWDPDANFGYGGYVTYFDGVSTQSWAWIAFYGYGCDDMRVAARNAVGLGPWSYVFSCYW